MNTVKDNQSVRIRQARLDDIEHFFRFQLDPEAIQMAAFTSENPHDREAYISKWTKLLDNPEIQLQAILFNDQIVGSVGKFVIFGDEANVTYWLDKPFWGKGIARQALKLFLELEKTRPLHGRTAFDNIGSQKVLEACGFVKIATEKGYANARKSEIVEFVFQLK